MLTREKAEGWLKVLGVVIVAVLATVFFIHLVLLVLLGGGLLMLAIWVAERILGPEVRVRLTVPPALRSAFRSWLRRGGFPRRGP